jgi:UDP:flavonoid glycosyltransferase YjiC (YdhE family)
MARILFITWDGGGNVPPAVGIADELRQRGHEITFLGHAQQRQHLENAGYHFTAYSRTVPWSSAEPTSGLAAGRRIFAMFTDKGQGRDLRELLGRRPADLLVVDCMMLGALDFARQSGPPYAVLVHT